MEMVSKKEDHIRKLKTLSFSNLTESLVVRNLFGGMLKTTANFIIFQLRCAVKVQHRRRWSLEETIMALSIIKSSEIDIKEHFIYDRGN